MKYGFQRLQKRFPGSDMSVKRVYLDNSASTRVDDEVMQAMLPYFTEVYGNASSTHQYGQRAKQAIEDAREQVAALLNADKTEITFLSGGTESDNLAIKGVAEANREKGRHIITSQIEHPAVLAACGRLEKQGWRVTYLPTDAVQSVGKIPVNVKDLGVDLLTLTAHKIYGPKGAGVLYTRRGVRVTSQMHGGHHERDRRAGTESVPLIVGLGKVAELARLHLAERMEHAGELRDYLEAELFKRIPDISRNGDPGRRVPNIANLNFDRVEGEGLQISLDLKGVAVSTGSACASGSTEPSHVLMAIGLPRDSGYGSLRFSFGKYNTKEDVDYTLEILQAVVEKLRRLSPV